jgi:hypothetical protein
MKTALISGGTIFALALLGLVVLMLSFSRSCPTEDSDLCYWDASTQGNGQGTSFVSILNHTIPITL